MYADDIEKTVTQTVAEVSEKSEQEIWEKRDLHNHEEIKQLVPQKYRPYET